MGGGGGDGGRKGPVFFFFLSLSLVSGIRTLGDSLSRSETDGWKDNITGLNDGMSYEIIRVG